MRPECSSTSAACTARWEYLHSLKPAIWTERTSWLLLPPLGIGSARDAGQILLGFVFSGGRELTDMSPRFLRGRQAGWGKAQPKKSEAGRQAWRGGRGKGALLSLAQGPLHQIRSTAGTPDERRP